MRQPTSEQGRAIAAIRSGVPVLVRALAGTGKTTTIQAAIEQDGPRSPRTLYTAFGARNIREAKAKLPRRVAVRTTHSMAWSLGMEYQRRDRLAKSFPFRAVSEQLVWPAGGIAGIFRRDAVRMVASGLSRFMQSADPELERRHFRDVPEVALEGTLRTAQRVWRDWEDLHGALPIVHDAYLKLWALRDPRLPFDRIFLDEAQDTNAVVLGVLKRQGHAQIVAVGDPHQAIYAYRGAVDAMSAFTAGDSFALSHSWRFGEAIAGAGNAALQNACHSADRLWGRADLADRITVVTETPTALIARTNLTLLAEALHAEQAGFTTSLAGGAEDLADLLEDMQALSQGRPAFRSELASIESWAQLMAAKDLPQGAKPLRRLLEAQDFDAVTTAIRRLTARLPHEADLLLCTAHRSKGLEFDRVILANDFPVAADGKAPSGGQEANLLYVAMTRARQQLDLHRCEAARRAIEWAPVSRARRVEAQPVPGENERTFRHHSTGRRPVQVTHLA
jgi:superfamily I DNA/RNA helicase